MFIQVSSSNLHLNILNNTKKSVCSSLQKHGELTSQLVPIGQPVSGCVSGSIDDGLGSALKLGEQGSCAGSALRRSGFLTSGSALRRSGFSKSGFALRRSGFSTSGFALRRSGGMLSLPLAAIPSALLPLSRPLAAIPCALASPRLQGRQ